MLQSSCRKHRVSGHFGELMQGRLGPAGPLALITLPCPLLQAEVSGHPGPLQLHQPGATLLTLPRARRFLAALRLPVRGGFVLRSNMLPGGGTGASTAALVALARAAGADAARIAAACLAIEGASDPLMFAAPERLLWASRQGQVLGQLPPLPQGVVLGGHWGPVQRTQPQDLDFPDISDLLAAWPAACRDIGQMAALCAVSAARSLARRGPHGDPTAALAARLGALGHVIAHTGSARGLIFAPGTLPKDAAATLQQAGFSRIIRFRIGQKHA